MLFILVIFCLVLITFLCKLFYGIRYDFNFVILYMITKAQGQNFKMVTKHKEVKDVLMLSDKGTVIEELLATPAWRPILSIESVNHNLWHELKKNFLTFAKALPPKSELGNIAHFELQKLLDNNGNKINSKDISKITLKIFTNWIFKDTTFEHDSTMTCLSDDQLERIYQSSIEYRKEIALKGKGDMWKKQDAVDIMVHLLSNNSRYKSMFDWKVPTNYSAVLQPFIISPMINVSDISVAVKKHINVYDKLDKDIGQYVDFCIESEHPFPVFERYDHVTNTQFFIDLSKIENESSDKSYAFNYSHGPRACTGRHYAREFLNRFFSVILEREAIDFGPNELHLFSGRDNDNGNLSESWYQVKLVCAIMYDILKKKFLKFF